MFSVHGGHGRVYQVVMGLIALRLVFPYFQGVLANGVHVAIKKRRVFSETIQSDVQFENELQIIPKLQHANVIKLLGCCTEGNERILVYEYMPKSLDKIIQGTSPELFAVHS